MGSTANNELLWNHGWTQINTDLTANSGPHPKHTTNSVVSLTLSDVERVPFFLNYCKYDVFYPLYIGEGKTHHAVYGVFWVRPVVAVRG